MSDRGRELYKALNYFYYKLNGHDLTKISHKDVVDLFAQTIPICTMTVYRETLDNTSNFSYEYREEVLRINLFKEKGQPLGIKLGHRRYYNICPLKIIILKSTFKER